MTAVVERVQNLEARMESTERRSDGAIATLAKDVRGLKRTVDGHSGYLSEIRNVQTGHTAAIAGLQGDIREMRAVQTGHTAAIAGLQGDIREVRAVQGEHSARFDAIDAQLGSHGERFDGIDAQLKRIEDLLVAKQ